MFLSGRIISRAESRYFKSPSTVYLSVWGGVCEGVLGVCGDGVRKEGVRGMCSQCEASVCVCVYM